jgi:hypothetical protein
MAAGTWEYRPSFDFPGDLVLVGLFDVELLSTGIEEHPTSTESATRNVKPICKDLFMTFSLLCCKVKIVFTCFEPELI